MGEVPSFQSLLAEGVRDARRNASQHLHPTLQRLVRTTGLDRTWVRGEGCWLEDDAGERYLDCLAGFAVHALGRHHPDMVRALRDAIASDLPGWVRMEDNPLAALLARRLAERMPADLPHAFFTNSGAEAVEASLKFARHFTGRSAVLACEHGFHGMTLGALAANGNASLRDGFGELGASRIIPFDDLPALEEALATRQFAAFIVEPVQGKTCQPASPGYLAEATRLCRAAGTLLIVDEVQTGVGRTGTFLACEQDPGCRPDFVVLSKALSGGYVPVGAAMVRADVWRGVYSSMSRAFVHSSTLHEGVLAMTAGLTVLAIHDAQRLSERARTQGDALRARLLAAAARHGGASEVRGRGLMLGIALERSASERWISSLPSLGSFEHLVFGQAFVMDLFAKGKVLAQVTGGGVDLLKLTPPLVISDEEVAWAATAFEGACQRLGSGPWAFASGVSRAAANIVGGVVRG
ncbi:MAG: aspartate aminotransferase family protein [Phycisphaerales bacterium]